MFQQQCAGALTVPCCRKVLELMHACSGSHSLFSRPSLLHLKSWSKVAIDSGNGDGVSESVVSDSVVSAVLAA